MKTIFRKSVFCTALLLCAVVPSAFSEPLQNIFGDCKVASNDELDQMRGGFSINTGSSQVLLSLGFQQVTYINGILAAMTTLNLPQISSAVSIPLQQNFIPTQIVQNGSGNIYIPPSSLPSNVTTLIQNNLNNQTISHMNIINATISSKQLLNAMNIASTMHQALSFSLR